MSVVEWMLGMRPHPPRGAVVRRAVSGQLIVITGASRGIGAECARRLAAAGARVVLIARSAQALEEVAQMIRRRGGEAHIVALDLRDRDEVERAAQQLLADFGTPAVVVSNAGHSVHRTLAQYADRGHDVERVFGVNLLGPVALLRVLVPAMQANGGGSIVSVSSVSAVVPAGGWSVYGASKAAADAWFHAVAQEVAPEVKISIVRLPLVRTAMISATPAYASAPAMRPVDAAALVAQAIVSGRRVIGPWWLRVAGVLLAAWPKALDRALGSHERRLRRP